MGDVIRTEDVFQCPLCNNEERKVLCTGLRDSRFNAPGEWAFKECCNCGAVFLDPRPIVEDLGRAYANYYTHSSIHLSNGFLHRLRRYVRGGYLAAKFGYVGGITPMQRLAGWLAYLHPGQRELMNASVMYLPAKHRGRLLDVGCGSGEKLAELRSLGWEVAGVDFDAEAVKVARHSYDLNVQAGTLEDQHYPAECFDAIITFHVIEHLHDPVEFLRECRRVLKPGGVLVITTPNVGSHLYRHFKCNWFSLDPPRHLVLFSTHTMSRLISKSGLKLEGVETNVRGAYHVFIRSREIRKNGFIVRQAKPPKGRKVCGHVYQYLMVTALRIFPNAGEQLVAMVVKDD